MPEGWFLHKFPRCLRLDLSWVSSASHSVCGFRSAGALGSVQTVGCVRSVGLWRWGCIAGTFLWEGAGIQILESPSQDLCPTSASRRSVLTPFSCLPIPFSAWWLNGLLYLHLACPPHGPSTADEIKSSSSPDGCLCTTLRPRLYLVCHALSPTSACVILFLEGPQTLSPPRNVLAVH